MKNNIHILTLGLALICHTGYGQQFPIPTQKQVDWQEMETTAFLHFSINTFTGKEWGEGTEDPRIFNPSSLDARQWVRSLKAAGFKLAIITAKHHDGFCLWPSHYTDYSVKNSPWKNGKGDLVKEVADACREFGIKFGFYLSPWDRHEATYGTAAYNDYYKAQLRELLTNYGPVAEVWFDGAKGEHAKDMVYDFEAYWQLVRQLQPNAIIYSGVGPDVRWVGNEKGMAGETNWSTVTTDGMLPGKVDKNYLNKGDSSGKKWMPAETDVSIRKGWFWRAEENNSVRSGNDIMNLYCQSVGRNSLLLLNIPPNCDGVLDSTDIKAFTAFHKILEASFAHNLVKGKANKKLVDHVLKTGEVRKDGKPLEFDLGEPKLFDAIVMQENIYRGQRCGEGLWEYWDGGIWRELQRFTTIGYKRILRFGPIRASKLRCTVTRSINGRSEIAEIGIYKTTPD